MIDIWYFGHFGLETGFGRAATDLAIAMARQIGRMAVTSLHVVPINGMSDEMAEAWKRADAPRGILDVVPGPAVPSEESWWPPDDSGKTVAIVHTLPWDCGELAAFVRRVLGDRVPVIAYTAWEASLGADLANRLVDGRFAQLWVPSRVNGAAFSTLDPTYSRSRGAGDFLRVVPHTYDPGRQSAIPRRPETIYYRFYWSGAWNARKNPAGVIRAFAHAFVPGEHAHLHLHSPGTSPLEFVEAMASTCMQQGDLQISFDASSRSPASILELPYEHDCYVTASRGEAWNLPAFEAAMAGRHVIAPTPQGSDDYLLSSTADLYPARLAPAHMDVRMQKVQTPDGRVGYAAAGSIPKGLTSHEAWHDPDLIALAAAMRRAYRENRTKLTLSYDPADRFGYTAVAAAAIHNLLEALV